MNQKSFVLLLSVMAFSVLATISCNVGLGESIDIEPPSLEILTLGEDSVGRVLSTDDGKTGGFVTGSPIIMSGTCSDDKGLQSIEVVLKDGRVSVSGNGTNTNADDDAEEMSMTQSKLYTFFATISADAKTWECVIDSKDVNNPIPDGFYEATVIATDTFGRTARQTKSFIIDSALPPVAF